MTCDSRVANLELSRETSDGDERLAALTLHIDMEDQISLRPLYARTPLLAEAGGRVGYPWLDRILVVDAPEAVQHARLMRRDGVDEALAGRMIAAQASRQERLALADDLVVNDGEPSHLDAMVAELHARYSALAGAASPDGNADPLRP